MYDACTLSVRATSLRNWAVIALYHDAPSLLTWYTCAWAVSFLAVKMLVASVLVGWLLALSMVYVSVVVGAARFRSDADTSLRPRLSIPLTVSTVSLLNRLSIATLICWE